MVDAQDEGFHEIQLNGKQLVFLFMAATVVSVVIFLCGVLVGRGVRTERGLAADAAGGNISAETTPPLNAASTPAPPPPGSDPTTVAPPPAVDDLSYFNRLEKPSVPDEQLKAAASQAAVPPPTPAAPAVKAASAMASETKPGGATAGKAAAKQPAAAAADADVAEASAEPAGQGFAVQIAALNVRGEAEAIARRLTSKGYAAYVLSPATGTPTVFRVRVGKFGSRREAETVAAKLQKEEQFKPWVTR